jgi:PD-(D/E)XK nuclease superfamily
MTFTVAQFLRFTRCPALYDLADVQGVPMPPTTRQVVSRAVRAVVLQECQAKIDTGAISEVKEARQRVERAVQAEMAQDIAYTREEAARGQRTAFERALRSAAALVNLWRAAVSPRIQPVWVSVWFGNPLSGALEIVEQSNVRLTRVRSRRPAADEAQHDVAVAIHMAAYVQPVIVDYLIEADPLVVDRQTVEYDEAKVVALRERVRQMVACVEAGVFPPTDPAYWRCQSCSLRMCCRYV